MGRDRAGSLLLIDDAATSRAMLGGWLTSEGLQVFESSTGRGAVERVATFRPDVVVCDLHMPDRDGYLVIADLREAGLTPPVIVVSADDAVASVLLAIRHGAFDYVVKRNGREALLAAVERALRHAVVLRDNERLTRQLTQANDALAARLLELQRQNRQRAMVEDALTLARDHALSASRAKSAFLTHMSHELRTPLNAMLGYAELMAESVEDPTIVGDLGRIVHAGHHLLSLIDDVLDLAKVEAGHATIEPTEVDVAAIVDAVRLHALPSVQQRGLMFTVEHAASAAEDLLIDKRLLLQCLHQLVDNAVKFTDEGGVTLRVDRDEDEIRFSVVDTGCGISARQRAAIFGAFIQGDMPPRDRASGPGLGLTIAQRLCDLMGGRLLLDSEVGLGSTFTIVVPLCVTSRQPVRSARVDGP